MTPFLDALHRTAHAAYICAPVSLVVSAIVACAAVWVAWRRRAVR